MDDSVLTVTKVLDAELIADLSCRAFVQQPKKIQEILLQSKSEQTFSGILATQLNSLPTFRLGDPEDEKSGHVMLEFKGKDYERKSKSGVKKSRNYHDLSIVNSEGKFGVIIENKFWYHFDGCKGKKEPKVEKGIFEQFEGDIYKIRRTLMDAPDGARGYVLLNVVTPSNSDLIPKSYRQDHIKVLSRTKSDLSLYRAQALNGFQSAIQSFSKEFNSVATKDLKLEAGIVDFFCAEVIIK